MRFATTVAISFLVCLTACEEKIVQGKAPAPAQPEDAGLSPSSAEEAEDIPKIDFQEAEFAESERSRDPFRSFAQMFVDQARGKFKSQREVVLDQYSLDELRLIGIVTRIRPAKAMLVDPTGMGHVIQRGQFVGRPEIVQVGAQGGASYEINWRVDRIRDGDIVLVREDPSNPDVPSATRVIPLRPEGAALSLQ